jgi:integral membrane protein
MLGKNPVQFLRTAALVEAVSFLVLLGVAMPLKYAAGMPGAVKLLGWAHGVLFVVFCLALAQTFFAARWPVGRAALVFVSALVPFGPMLLDSRMKRYVAEYDERAAGAEA